MNDGNNILFFIQSEDDALISLIKSAGAIDGCISVRI
jgi:hypothetical protein